jgi:hypothetical protein
LTRASDFQIRTLPKSSANAYTEIESFRTAWGKISEVPSSVIGVLEMVVERWHWMHIQSVESHRKKGEATAPFDRMAVVETALLLILRESMNQSEREGLAARIASDERKKNE